MPSSVFLSAKRLWRIPSHWFESLLLGSVRVIKGNKVNQNNAIQGQRPDIENRHTQQRT